MIQGMGGMMSVTGEPDDAPGGGPQRAGVPIADIITGMYASIAICAALANRERTGKGSYVTTSLLAEGVWSASVSIQAALCGATFFGPHDRENPANAALNVYRASDGTWFLLIVTPDKLPAVAKALGREDLLTDPRFSDPEKLKRATYARELISRGPSCTTSPPPVISSKMVLSGSSGRF